MSQDILFNLRNVISDRTSTEKKFGELLDYRKDVLPGVIKNWDQLSSEVQENLAKLHFFYCVMCVLVHFAECDCASLPLAENGYFNSNVPIYDTKFKKNEKVEL